jgi:ribonuclease Z
MMQNYNIMEFQVIIKMQKILIKLVWEIVILKIVFTGTGTPIIDPKLLRAGASEVVIIGNDVLLFDCGRWVSMRLIESDIGIEAVNYLFLTHHHHDHTADLPAVTCRRSSSRLLQIFGPSGTKKALTQIKEIFNKPLHPDEIGNKIEFYDVDAGFVCKGESWQVTAAGVTHIYQQGESALAYRIDSDEGSIVISGDVTAVPPNLNSRAHSYSSNIELRKLAKDTDVYVMDADLVHTTPEQIGIAAEESGAKTIVLTHIQNPGFKLPKPSDSGIFSIDLIQPINDIFKKKINHFYKGKIILAQDLGTLEI